MPPTKTFELPGTLTSIAPISPPVQASAVLSVTPRSVQRWTTCSSIAIGRPPFGWLQRRLAFAPSDTLTRRRNAALTSVARRLRRARHFGHEAEHLVDEAVRLIEVNVVAAMLDHHQPR